MSYSEGFRELAALIIPGFSDAVWVFTLALGAACIITPIEIRYPAYRQSAFHRDGFWLDVGYWFLTPLVTRATTGLVLALLVSGTAYCLGISLPTEQTLQRGFGPISRQPFPLQVFEILLISDLVDYWTHRWFHLGSMWRIHAIHHSPQEMNWLSSARVHPLNDLVTRGCQFLPIMLLGYGANVVLAVVPLVSIYVMFLHSNISWDFGPLRWVLVSPAYHRWHHTSDSEGIDRNFAGIFPVWDLLFGTCYFPRTLPKAYGVKGAKVPTSFFGQLAFPFTFRRSARRPVVPKAPEAPCDSPVAG